MMQHFERLQCVTSMVSYFQSCQRYKFQMPDRLNASFKLQWWCQIFITLTFKTTSSSGQSVEKIKMSKHKT